MANPFDSTNYPTEHPECIILGRHIGWKLDEDFAAADFTLSYSIQPVGDDNADAVTIDGAVQTINGEQYWVFELTAATSGAAPWTDTFTKDIQCRWDLIVTEVATTNVAVLYSGFLRLYIAASDRRSHAEIMVAKINSILENRADHDVSSYSIKSRSISRMPVNELIEWRDYYLNELRTDGATVNTGGSKAKRNTIRVRFE